MSGLKYPIIAAWLVFGLMAAVPTAYRLGPGDKVAVQLANLREIEIKPALIEGDGMVDFEHAGRLTAAGLTCLELAAAIETRLSTIVKAPKVRVEVLEYGSQPVSVMGAVNRPGVHQLRGSKTLMDMLALAEGLKPDAGNVVKITRRKGQGPLPVPGARADLSGEFVTGQVQVKALMEARTPELNIEVHPHDVISVPRADLIYVLGKVKRPGGFPLAERESMTILQALALAEGIDGTGSAQDARLIRESGTPDRSESPVDVKKILLGQAPDRPLLPNDILFIPGSKARSAGLRALEVAIQLGTGIAIFRRY